MDSSQTASPSVGRLPEDHWDTRADLKQALAVWDALPTPGVYTKFLRVCCPLVAIGGSTIKLRIGFWE